MSYCRYCGEHDLDTELIKYAVRHYAHPDCALKKHGAAFFEKLTPWQCAVKFPGAVARKHGVYDQLVERAKKDKPKKERKMVHKIDERVVSNLESRYHIIGYWTKPETLHKKHYDLAGHEGIRTDAFERAKHLIGPNKYDGVEVYDSMAKFGSTCTWDVDISGRGEPIDTKQYPKKALHKPTLRQ